VSNRKAAQKGITEIDPKDPSGGGGGCLRQQMKPWAENSPFRWETKGSAIIVEPQCFFLDHHREENGYENT
jgi:hypothetical protein